MYRNYAWYAGRRTSACMSRPYLMAAWGYTLGLAYVSFFGQWKAGFAAADPSGLPVAGVLAFKSVGPCDRGALPGAHLGSA